MSPVGTYTLNVGQQSPLWHFKDVNFIMSTFIFRAFQSLVGIYSSCEPVSVTEPHWKSKCMVHDKRSLPGDWHFTPSFCGPTIDWIQQICRFVLLLRNISTHSFACFTSFSVLSYKPFGQSWPDHIWKLQVHSQLEFCSLLDCATVLSRIKSTNSSSICKISQIMELKSDQDTRQLKEWFKVKEWF